MDYTVAFRGSDGEVVLNAPLTRLLTMPVTALKHWRDVQNFSGQHHLTGQAWMSRMGRHVMFESRLEQHALLHLDHDPDFVWVVAQPFVLSWRHNGTVKRHVPDFLAQFRTGTPVIIDVKPKRFQNHPDNVVAFGATRSACEALAWRYEVWSEPSLVLRLNLRWLGAHHRTPADHHLYGPALLTRLQQGPQTIGALATSLEPECRVRPALFHLLWRRDAVTDLECPLSDHSLVRIG